MSQDTSHVEDNGPGLVGSNWSSGTFVCIQDPGSIGSTPTSIDIVTPAAGVRTFEWDTTASTYLPTGGNKQYVERTTFASGGDTYNIFRLVEPGSWELDFYREGGDTPSDLEGLPLQMRDLYQNVKNFSYTTISSGTFPTIRLDKIELGEGPVLAEVHFNWIDDSPNPNNGRLASVEIKRHDGVSWVTTQKAEYTYLEEYVSSINADPSVGTNGDLIQVVVSILVDAPTAQGLVYHKTVTQYRYHGGEDNEEAVGEPPVEPDTDGDGFAGERGDLHQLKAVIMPEQIEFAAQLRNQAIDPDVDVVTFAESLLDLADGDDVYSGADYTIMNLAAKVVSKYEVSGEQRVEEQYLQSACGCGGGGTQTVQLAYKYYESGAGSPSEGDIVRSTHIVESYDDGMGFLPYRTHIHNLGYYESDFPSVAAQALYKVDHMVIDDAGDRWVVYVERDTTNHMPVLVATPEAIETYTPGIWSPSGPSVTLASSGLIFEYTYSGDRVSETSVKDGSSGTPRLLTKITYGDGAGDTRTHLPTKIEKFRHETLTTADYVETQEYTYKFHSGNLIKSTEMSMEAELVSENGPTGTGNKYYTHTFYDTQGRNTWIRQADNTLSKRTFDTTTGSVLTVVENSDDTGLPDTTGLTGDFSGRDGDGGSLTYTYTYDLLGRIRTTTGPSGLVSRVTRELRTLSQRPGLEYMAIISLPHTFVESSEDRFTGAATVQWLGAGGLSLRTSDYELEEDDTSLYAGIFGSGYEFDISSTELSRQVVTHNIAGQTTTKEQWYRLSGSGHGSGITTTAYTYDPLGRLFTTTSPNGTVTRYTYDVRDRIVEVEMGTDAGSPGDMKTVSETFYDSAQTATQGIGNGKVTFVRNWVDDSNSRDTKMYYDYRGRLIKEEGEAPPHLFHQYDNLGRVIATATFVDLPPSDIDDASYRDDRLSYSEVYYSQRGLAYRSRDKIDPTTTITNADYLESHAWYDEVGRIVGAWGPNGPGAKIEYDGLGRTTRTFLTNRGGDAAPGASGNYAAVYTAGTHTANVTGDIVLEQVEVRYIEPVSGDVHRGLVDLVTHWSRAHDAHNTGALGSNNSAITTYAAAYYDDADRLVRVANYGTNTTGFVHSGSAPTVNQASPPSSSDTVPVAMIAYDDYGDVDLVIDPLGRETRYFYDDMERVIAVVENYVDGAVSWSTGVTPNRWVASGINTANPDEDRIVSTVYDEAGNVVLVTAHVNNSGTGDQVTQYIYGVSTGGSPASDINAEDMLFKIIYPDGQASSTEADRTVYFAYNRVSEPKVVIDQNGNQHTLSYDDRGRLILDQVAFAMSTHIDDTIDAIRTDYDFDNRTVLVRSYDGYNGGSPNSNVVNAVRFDANDLGQLVTIWQEHTGDVVDSGGSASPKVSYTYENEKLADGNYSRPTSMEFPDGGGKVLFHYGTPGSLNDTISRLQSIVNTEPTSGMLWHVYTYAQYQYLGAGMPVIVDNPDIDVLLDHSVAHNGERNDGVYPAFDHLGRPVRHAWVDGSLTEHGTLSTVPNIPPIVELTFAFDRNSNMTNKLDGRPGSKWTNRDARYTYDLLNRLEEAERGNLVSTTWTDAARSQKWLLDPIGNWQKVWTDIDGDGSYEDTTAAKELDDRDHNDVNELLERIMKGQGSGTTDITLDMTFDKVGNMLSQEVVNRFGGATTITYTYDAWNRLVLVEYDAGSGDEPREAYSYDGLHQRIIVESDSDQTPDGVLDQQRDFYYDAAWRVVQDRLDEDYVNDAGMDSYTRYFWGIRGLDDIIARRQNNDFTNDTDGASYEGTWFHITDHQFSTVALLDDTAALVERVVYDPYGLARHHHAEDVDGNGFVTSGTDYTAIAAVAGGSNNLIGQANYQVAMDIDRDGDVDWNDATIVNNAGTKVGLPTGWISSPTSGGGDNIVGYCGYLLNRATGQMAVRFRVFDPNLGRWIQRDPAGYMDSMGLYGYGPGSPGMGLDPFGLEEQKSVFWAGVGGFFQGAWEGYIMAADNVNLGLNPLFSGYADKIRRQNAGNGWYMAGDWTSWSGATILHVVVAGGVGQAAARPIGGVIASELGKAALPGTVIKLMVRQIGKNATGIEKFHWLIANGYWYQIALSPLRWPTLIYLTIKTGPTKLGWVGVAAGAGGAYYILRKWFIEDSPSNPAPRGGGTTPSPVPVPGHGFGGHGGGGNNTSGQSSPGGPQAGLGGSDCP